MESVTSEERQGCASPSLDPPNPPPLSQLMHIPQPHAAVLQLSGPVWSV